MLKEALEFLLNLKAPTIDKIDGCDWSDRPLIQVARPAVRAPINVESLDALIDYAESQVDSKLFDPESAILVVQNSQLVHLAGSVGVNGERSVFMIASWSNDRFPMGKFMDQESFLIELIKGVDENNSPDFSALMEFVSQVAAQQEDGFRDNGIYQQVVVRQGINVEAKRAPRIMKLAFHRSFPEVPTVQAKVCLRMRMRENAVLMALFDVDNKTWEIQARSNIAQYLKSKQHKLWIIVS